ncbi:hypothetical protein ACSMEV_00520 [Pseudomonas sp. MLB6B]
MKKPVPDPPSKIIHTPYLAIHADLSPQDALTYVEQLLHAIEASLDEYCMANADTPELGLLIGAAHAARSGQALLVHVLGLSDTGP